MGHQAIIRRQEEDDSSSRCIWLSLCTNNLHPPQLLGVLGPGLIVPWVGWLVANLVNLPHQFQTSIVIYALLRLDRLIQGPRAREIWGRILWVQDACSVPILRRGMVKIWSQSLYHRKDHGNRCNYLGPCGLFSEIVGSPSRYSSCVLKDSFLSTLLRAYMSVADEKPFDSVNNDDKELLALGYKPSFKREFTNLATVSLSKCKSLWRHPMMTAPSLLDKLCV